MSSQSQPIAGASPPVTDGRDMVERVADALWPLTEWNGDRLEAVRAARAAMEAMREPTPEMAGAIYDNCEAWECFRADGESWDAERVYTAMIDAALKETP